MDEPTASTATPTSSTIISHPNTPINIAQGVQLVKAMSKIADNSETIAKELTMIRKALENKGESNE